MIERAVILSAGSALNIDVADLKSQTANRLTEKAAAPKLPTSGAIDDVLEETERQLILDALKQSNWVVAGPNGAAARLGKKRSTLQMRIYKLGISRLPA